MTTERRAEDERIEKILESVNAIKLSMETFHIRCAGDMALNAQMYKAHDEKILGQHKTLYDADNGLCKIVQIDHVRVGLLMKLMWGVGGAIIGLAVNAFGKLILK